MRKTKIAYAVLLLLAVILYIAFNGTMSFVILVFSLLLPLMLLILTRITASRLQVGFQASRLAVNKSAEVELNLLLFNKSPFSLPRVTAEVEYTNTLDGIPHTIQILVPLHAKKRQSICFSAVSKYCGRLVVRVKTIRVYDHIMLFSASAKTPPQQEVLILPQPHILDLAIVHSASNSSQDEVFSAYHPGDDPSEIFGLRDYVPGDGLNRIHWKLSSKQDSLIVKDYSLPISCSVLLLFDFFTDYTAEDYMSRLDTQLETLVSISEQLVEKELPHIIGWYCKKNKRLNMERITDNEELSMFMKKLLISGSYDDDCHALNHFNAEYADNDYTDIIYFSSRAEKLQLSYLETLSQLRRLKVLFSIGEADAEKVAKASGCTFELRGIPEGKISESLIEMPIFT